MSSTIRQCQLPTTKYMGNFNQQEEIRYRVIFSPELNRPVLKITVRFFKNRVTVIICGAGHTEIALISEDRAIEFLEKMDELKPFFIPSYSNYFERPFVMLDGENVSGSVKDNKGNYHTFMAHCPDPNYELRLYEFVQTIYQLALQECVQESSQELLSLYFYQI